MQNPVKPMSALPVPELEKTRKNKTKTKMPSPQELLSHYESQGLDSHQASLRAIDHLQKMLFRVVSSRGPNPDKVPPSASASASASRKMDALYGRLALLEMKLDSKPGYAEAFAIGVASGAALNGLGSLMPHVLTSLSQIWSSVASLHKNPHHHQ